MSEIKQDVPSTTTTCDKHDDGWSGSKPATTKVADPSLEILLAINDMLALTLIDDGKVNEEDMSDAIENMDALLKEKKIERPARKMYQRYLNPWIAFCAKEKFKEEYDDASLVKFFKQIEPSYKPNTLWVLYSCTNARFIDEFGKNLKHLPRLHRHLKQVTQLYVATKSATFTPEEIHKVLHTLQDSPDEKLSFYGLAIALLYYNLLRCSEVRMIRVKYVQIEGEQDGTFIEVNFMYQQKHRNKGIYLPYS